MQTIINYFALLLTGLVLQAQNTVAVTMTNFSSNEGTVQVGLYDNEGTWLTKTYKGEVVSISNNLLKKL